MHSSLRTVHASYRRGCPACGDAKCSDPDECLFLLTSRPWADCYRCDGSGRASESNPAYNPLAIYCDSCTGSGLMEHSRDSISPDEISENARERHAVFVARLTAVVDTPRVCPGCRVEAPGWHWIRSDGMRILTHDGDLICPKDRTFGYTPAPAPAPLAVVA